MKNCTLEHDAENFLQSLYLSWVNDFISYEGFAQYYRISKAEAVVVIDLGKMAHERLLKERAA